MTAHNCVAGDRAHAFRASGEKFICFDCNTIVSAAEVRETLAADAARLCPGEMVRRVAKALMEHCDGFTVFYEGETTAQAMARAAITAMKAPTDQMIDVGLHDAEGFNLLGVGPGALAKAYVRMIDAALEDRDRAA